MHRDLVTDPSGTGKDRCEHSISRSRHTQGVRSHETPGIRPVACTYAVTSGAARASLSSPSCGVWTWASASASPHHLHCWLGTGPASCLQGAYARGPGLGISASVLNGARLVFEADPSTSQLRVWSCIWLRSLPIPSKTQPVPSLAAALQWGWRCVPITGALG